MMKKLPLSGTVHSTKTQHFTTQVAEYGQQFRNYLDMKNPIPCRYRHMQSYIGFYGLTTCIDIQATEVLRRQYGCGILHCLVPFFPLNLVTQKSKVLSKRAKPNIQVVHLKKRHLNLQVHSILFKRCSCNSNRQSQEVTFPRPPFNTLQDIPLLPLLHMYRPSFVALN